MANEESQPPVPPASGDTAVADGEDSRTSALEARACPKCGGKAVWSPRQQALVCPYCGYVLHEGDAAADEQENLIREIDLHATIRSVEEASRGIEKGVRKVHCRHCNADSLMPTDRVADRCPFCGSPEIVSYDAIDSAIRPESLLPKQLDKARAHEIFKSWVKDRFWAPSDLKGKNLVEQLKGVYLPYWTFDADSVCPWTAESGTYYWDTESYTDAQGNRRTRQVRKVRWSPASGTIRHRFDDVTAPATTIVPPDQLRAIEPFPTTTKLIPYDTVYVAGWVVEHYQGTLLDGAKQGRAQMQAVLRQLCAQAVPGDTYRNLRIDPRYSKETFKHILVPVWLLLYTYRRKLYRTVINGYTGKIDGQYPKSVWKILAAVLLAILAIGIAVLVFSGGR